MRHNIDFQEKKVVVYTMVKRKYYQQVKDEIDTIAHKYNDEVNMENPLLKIMENEVKNPGFKSLMDQLAEGSLKKVL